MAARLPAAPRLRPGFGPPLPALLRRRLGVPERATAAAAAIAVLGLGALAAAIRPGEPGEPLVHRGDPAFSLMVPDGMAAAPPRPGELLRVEGRRGRVTAAIAVRPLRLPAHDGDVPHALLPVLATRHIEALERRHPTFRLIEEGRARFNDAPAYEIGFRMDSGRRRIFAADAMVVPHARTTADAVLLSLRRAVTGRRPLGEKAREFSTAARFAAGSFAYGEDRP